MLVVDNIKCSVVGVLRIDSRSNRRMMRDRGRIFANDASTKANVVLQFCSIGPDLVEAIAEVN